MAGGLTWDHGYLIVIAALFATTMFMAYEKFCRQDDARCKGITMTFGVLAALMAVVVIGIVIYSARKDIKPPTRPISMYRPPTAAAAPQVNRNFGYPKVYRAGS